MNNFERSDWGCEAAQTPEFADVGEDERAQDMAASKQDAQTSGSTQNLSFVASTHPRVLAQTEPYPSFNSIHVLILPTSQNTFLFHFLLGSVARNDDPATQPFGTMGSFVCLTGDLWS